MKNIRLRYSTELVNKCRSFIIKLNYLLAKNNILISFSGGQDSICLVILLIQLTSQFNLCLKIVYCNHLWNLDSLNKFSHILRAGFSLNQEVFFAVSVKKIFTEKSARIWRYSSIHRIAQFYNCTTILTAHTKTDQIETLLLNLFRSSSKGGLSIFLNDRVIINKSTKKIFLSEQYLNDV